VFVASCVFSNAVKDKNRAARGFGVIAIHEEGDAERIDQSFFRAHEPILPLALI
jgi:hypothetical protein